MSGADTSQTARFDGSVGVTRTKNGFGMTAVGIPNRASATPVAPSPISQKRRSRVAPRRGNEYGTTSCERLVTIPRQGSSCSWRQEACGPAVRETRPSARCSRFAAFNKASATDRRRSTLSESAPEPSGGSLHLSQGVRIVGGDEEEDVPRPDDMRPRHPIDHDATALGTHLPIRSDRGLCGRSIRATGEQEDIHRWPVSRTGDQRRRLLRDPSEPERTRQTSPRPVAWIKVVGHLCHGEASAPQRVGDSREVQRARGWRSARRAGAPYQHDSCQEDGEVTPCR